jgi:DNA-binding response OmpR family regulator
MSRIPTNRVVIVDDEEIIRDLLADFFSFNGYKAITAGNGRDALKIIEGTPCALLITDLNMPGMDGIELVKKVRNLGIPLTIIGTSVYHKEDEFLSAGADFFLLKPFDFRYLENTLNSTFKK